MSTTGRSDVRLTYDDFMRFPDDGKRHEIIDGVHYVSPSPYVRHQSLVGRLYLAIGNFLATRPHLGRIYLAPLDVVLSYYDVVEPDLLFVAGDQLKILTEKNVQGPPALVIEILSPGTRRRDRGIKRQLFARSGVREYWMVDPGGETVELLRRQADGQLAPVPHLTRDQRSELTSPLLPGFSLSLEALFVDL